MNQKLRDPNAVECCSFRAMYEGEHAHAKKLDADFSAARVGIMALQGELHEHLALMVRYFEEETQEGDGIQERHVAGYQAAKSLLVRSARNLPQWENAQILIAELLRKASHAGNPKRP